MRCTPETTGQSRPEGSCYASMTVPGRVESIRPAAAFIIQAARGMRVPRAADSIFESAIVEALNNAVKHGTAAKGPEASIVCEVEVVGQYLIVRILDEGPGFRLPGTPRPESGADDIATIPENGYGISIIQGVFPMVRTIARPGAFGVEMALTF